VAVVVTPATFIPSDTLTPSSSVCPSTSKATPTERVEPSKVRFASSSNSPSVPAITTLLSVRSSTFALLAVKSPATSRVVAGTSVPMPTRPVLTSANRVDTPTIRSPV
jgi:hypothetical protein